MLEITDRVGGRAGGNRNCNCADGRILQESGEAGVDDFGLPERLRSEIERIFGRDERRHKRFQVRLDLGGQWWHRNPKILAKVMSNSTERT